MAFDQHVAADQVGDGDVGLFSSLARPILWLLGDQDKTEEEKRKEERDKLEREILVASDVSDDGADDENGEKSTPGERGAEGSSQGINDGGGDMDMDIDAAGGGREGKDDAAAAENSNKFSTSLQSWPQIDNCDEEEDNHHHRRSSSENYVQPPRRRDNCSPVTQIVDDLVAVMESSTIDPGPATSAADSSAPNTMTLLASHSASAFPNHQIPQLHHAHSSNSSIRSKKTSWSDERGSRPLVEYSDDLETSYTSEHWTQLRRKKRRNSFDGDDKRSGTRRSQVRVIKSALRSGSYSPPVTKMYARGGAAMSTSSSASSTSSSRQSPPTGGDLRSFHSLSMVGSSSSGSSSPDPFNLSTNSSDSLAAETNQKLSVRDNVHVPSTLQQGRGRANGLIIPRGGPSAAYHLTLGTRVGGELQGRGAAKEKENNQAEGGASAPLNGNNYVNNGRKISPHHHMFLPHPPNGYVSPQYGFYVNITPPTPIHAAKRGSPLRPFEESSPQQQSYQQVNTFPPSPIPEVEFVNEKRPGPKLDPMSESVEPRATKTRLKPTFPKNRAGMGMVLAGNHHSHAWPSIPMG